MYHCDAVAPYIRALIILCPCLNWVNSLRCKVGLATDISGQEGVDQLSCYAKVTQFNLTELIYQNI